MNEKSQKTNRISNVSPEVRDYAEAKILPRYRAMSGHTDKHIEQVISRSLSFADICGEKVNLDMVYVIAAYHDLGREIDDDHHEIESARMLRSDLELEKFFTAREIETMAKAVEDHRASNKREPRSIYGRIVSSADRNTEVDDMLERCYDCQRLWHPEMTDDEVIEMARKHLREKYSPDGYAAKKMYFPDSDFAACLERIEEITRDPDEFRKIQREFNEKRGVKVKDPITDFLIRIVKEAEQISHKSFEVHKKGDFGDLVTTLDTEIEKYLINQIEEKYPGFDIVSEEFNSDGEMTDNCFIIDPIDGTVNFANGLPLWGIQIACRKDGETVASVISLPKLGEFYYADQTGAYLNDQKISIKEVPVKTAVYTILGGDNTECVRKMTKFSRNYRHLGSMCVSLGYMSCGRIHGVCFRKDNPWDYEPGLFLSKMAGAKVKSVEGFHAAAMNQKFLDLLEDATLS